VLIVKMGCLAKKYKSAGGKESTSFSLFFTLEIKPKLPISMMIII